MSFFQKLTSLSLRIKFIVPIAAMLIFSMTVVSVYLIDRQSESYLSELESRGATMVKMLAINAESGVLFGSTYELNDLLGALTAFEGVEFARITNREGVVLAQTGYRDSLVSASNSHSYRLKSTNDYTRFFHDHDDHEILVITAPIISQTQHLNRESLGLVGGVDRSMATERTSEEIGSIQLGLTLETVNQEILEAQTAAILLTVVVVLSTIAMLAFIVSAITKPVTELVSVTDQISRGDFSRKVEIKQFDEIGHLADTFNSMIESLKQSRDEIEQYNRNLEQKIIERTQQLEEAQQQLVQSEKMSAIGQLAAGVAHELNNPLGGILGYAQFTLEKLEKREPAKTSQKEIESYIRYVRDIEVQARRCKTIVQNLLRFSRSSKSVDFDEVDINKAIEETITFVEHQLKLNNVELLVTLDHNIPILIGNTGQLQQVFTNLIINAMHASEKGSRIEIVSKFSPALGEFAGAVELQFVDHGHGIPREHLGKVFEPFFTTKEVGKGTGLGLSVSYGIIKSHGGEINVTETPDGGATFNIVLPLQKPVEVSDSESVVQK